MLPPSQRPAACRRCDCAPQHVDAGDFVGKRAPRRTCCGPGDSSTRADKHSLFVCALYWMCDEPQQKTAARLPKTRSALAPAVSVLLVV